ncbi:MAG: acylphosphatase [Thermoguttaceae bacterium]
MASETAAPQQWEVVYAGTVQGVGFRYTCRRIASQLAVTGYVKNLRDGRVQLVVEGVPAEMDRFLRAIRAEFGAYITRVEQTARPATGQFRGFEIRF